MYEIRCIRNGRVTTRTKYVVGLDAAKKYAEMYMVAGADAACIHEQHGPVALAGCIFALFAKKEDAVQDHADFYSLMAAELGDVQRSGEDYIKHWEGTDGQ